MNLSFVILSVSGIAYGAAFALHLFSFCGEHEKGHRVAWDLMRVGFLVSTFYFIAESVEQGYFLPVSSLSQALSYFAWSLAFVYLILLARIQTESFGLILTPVLLLLLVASGWTFDLPRQPLTHLQSPFFTVHIATAFFAYASFTISFAAGVLYLIQHHELKSKHAGRFYQKLPSLESLEKLIYQPMIWGAVLLVTAVAIGFAWSKAAFGEYWISDPKTVATAVTVCVYFVILVMRSAGPLRGKQVAQLSLAAFVLMLFSFIGTRFIESSHNYFQ